MKDLKNVLTPELEKEQDEAIDKMAQMVAVQAKANNDDVSKGIGLSRVGAAIAFDVINSSDISICQGYITYHTGEILHFYAKQTSSYGGHFRMHGAWPSAYVLPYDQLVNVKGTYNIAGFWLGGILTLQANGREVIATPLPVAGSAGIRSWGAEGAGPFRRANKMASQS